MHETRTDGQSTAVGLTPRLATHRLADLLLAYFPALLALVVQVALLGLVGRHLQVLAKIEARSAEPVTPGASVAAELRGAAEQLKKEADNLGRAINQPDARALRDAAEQLKHSAQVLNDRAYGPWFSPLWPSNTQPERVETGRPTDDAAPPPRGGRVRVILGAAARSPGWQREVLIPLLEKNPERWELFDLMKEGPRPRKPAGPPSDARSTQPAASDRLLILPGPDDRDPKLLKNLESFPADAILIGPAASNPSPWPAHCAKGGGVAVVLGSEEEPALRTTLNRLFPTSNSPRGAP